MARVDVEHHAARGQRFEDVAGLGFGLLPEKRCCFGREGLDRKQRDEFGLCRREQDFEDLKQSSVGGAPCGKRLIRSDSLR